MASNTDISGLIGRALLWVAVAIAVAALAGCDRHPELKRPLGQTSHVSPTPVVVPHLPPGTFDQARAQAELARARAARQAGDAAGARKLAEAAVADWPGDPSAWEELSADCQSLGDAACVAYAAFFAAKVDFVNAQPPRVGTLGFATLAQGDLGTKTGDYTYDQKTLDTAARLASFYDERDPLSTIRIPPTPKPPEKQ